MFDPRTHHSPDPNGSTQRRKAHVARMQANGTWDPKTTPAEDPTRPGYRPKPGKVWDQKAHEYIDA